MADSKVRKSVLIQEDTHALLMARVKQVNANSADELLRMFLEEEVVRIPLPAVAYKRWTESASEAGFSLSQWVAQRVEAAIQYQADAGTIGRVMGKLFNK